MENKHTEKNDNPTPQKQAEDALLKRALGFKQEL